MEPVKKSDYGKVIQKLRNLRMKTHVQCYDMWEMKIKNEVMY